MKLDPESDPRMFVLTLVAAGFAIFSHPAILEMEDAWELAENFVREMEKRFGPLKP